ncbi:MAG TPA: hypothetical protein VGG03_23870, partial [Thermoanaerobaculia bacterium]
MAGSLLSEPQNVWTTNAYVMPRTVPCYGFGAVFYAGADGLFHAADLQTGQPKSGWNINGIPRSSLQSPV